MPKTSVTPDEASAFADLSQDQIKLITEAFLTEAQAVGLRETTLERLAAGVGLDLPIKERIIHVVVPPDPRLAKTYRLLMPEGDEATEDSLGVIGCVDTRGSRPAADFFNADGTLTDVALEQGYRLEDISGEVDGVEYVAPHRGENYGGWLDSDFKVVDKGNVRKS